MAGAGVDVRCCGVVVDGLGIRGWDEHLKEARGTGWACEKGGVRVWGGEEGWQEL